MGGHGVNETLAQEINLPVGEVMRATEKAQHVDLEIYHSPEVSDADAVLAIEKQLMGESLRFLALMFFTLIHCYDFTMQYGERIRMMRASCMPDSRIREFIRRLPELREGERKKRDRAQAAAIKAPRKKAAQIYVVSKKEGKA